MKTIRVVLTVPMEAVGELVERFGSVERVRAIAPPTASSSAPKPKKRGPKPAVSLPFVELGQWSDGDYESAPQSVRLVMNAARSLLVGEVEKVRRSDLNKAVVPLFENAGLAVGGVSPAVSLAIKSGHLRPTL